MIIYNQALTEKVDYVLDTLGIRGFTQWPLVHGRGSTEGEPRMGTHTWPEMNAATITMVPDEQVDLLLEKVRKIDQINTEVGIRAFVWNVEKSV